MTPAETAPDGREPVTIADTLSQTAARPADTDGLPAELDVSTLSPALLRALMVCHDKQGQDLKVFGTDALTPFYSWAVLVTGLSPIQRDVIARTVREELHQTTSRLLSQEGSGESGWILMDYRDFLLHILSPEKREYYSLESLMGDLPSAEPTEAQVQVLLGE